MVPRLVITEDGSTSIFIEEFNEHFHSIHGAIQESMHVFINAGLQYKSSGQAELSILEIGFGSGLNALLTCIEAITHGINIQYTAVEKYPLDPEYYKKLNYCTLLEQENCTSHYTSIYSFPWEKEYAVAPGFHLLKLECDIQHMEFADQFDIIYFDAFAPAAQPELWSTAIFTSMYNALKVGGVLVTYCAKGEVKRTMKQVGFNIEALPGPKGKREMTRAVK